jgi:DNA-binding NtrC family response regulator
MIENEKFRDDLYFRLNVFPIHVPPLRQRGEDIPHLVNFFIKKKCRDMGIVNLPSLCPGEIEMLKTYRWPGNVRELENIVERGIILSDGESVSFKGLLKPDDTLDNIKPASSLEGPIKLDDVIAQHLEKVLRSTNGRVHGSEGAAALLGVNSSTLRARMSKLGISFGRKVSKIYNAD